MKDNKRDEQNRIIRLELEKKQRHQYQATKKNQLPPSDKPSSDTPLDENDLNKKLRDRGGYSGY